MKAVWLIGFRGAGKSTVGAQLADRLGWRFLDLDVELELRLRCSILEFVQLKGEPAFRAHETELLREVSSIAVGRVVIATGGGFVDVPESRALVEAAAGQRVWLDPPAELLWERLSAAPDRLKIGHLTDFAAMRALLEKRRPFYEKISSFRLESQDISECLASIQRLVSGGT
jgi:shikimate kinase